MTFPTEWEIKIHVPNHQPVLIKHLRVPLMDWNLQDLSSLAPNKWRVQSTERRKTSGINDTKSTWQKVQVWHRNKYFGTGQNFRSPMWFLLGVRGQKKQRVQQRTTACNNSVHSTTTLNSLIFLGIVVNNHPQQHPHMLRAWDIYLHNWAMLIFLMADVGNYSSTMEHMGSISLASSACFAKEPHLNQDLLRHSLVCGHADELASSRLQRAPGGQNRLISPKSPRDLCIHL